MERYRMVGFDSARWDGFAFRDGDIVISAPAKCGTTWMQMICALLVFGTPDFEGDLAALSPWLDWSLEPRESVLATLGAQRHRRFIKTHTPLDGLPFDPRVTYVCVGRDPRDVGISLGNHRANIDPEAVARAREAAGLAHVSPAGAALSEETSERDRFRHWMLDDTPVTSSHYTLRFTMHHLTTFWQARESATVVMVHYDDLKADLLGEMRRLAVRLDITVPESAWPLLARAATFEDMRKQAPRLVPNVSKAVWRDNERFFNRGVSGQWVDVLDDTDLREYAARVTEFTAPDLLEWAHREPITQ
ncbi:sulfotransferase domain-containing protein [Pseudonocardia alaniniphila]|uniref:Sulfotransferase domain-containing protein n=1 Tax=Pseudonocardia alaniniphila TaxID=75291 RepID=A0ABS9TAJ3_9PSEU|nr:sulfotransferase domain-containing protein [Pseudonocardia alaniniphila]MCH6165559.1 sulfotransferase domain-containing protein [Pseudonocardia alaniniphila]